MTVSILQSALWYSKHGWAVLPLHSPVEGRCSCGKPDCSSPGKHPLTINGLTEATKDIGIITAWWTRWPHANVGIATGPASGLYVLDIDDKNGGMDSLGTLPALPDTVVCLTGGGGLHYFFKYPQNIILKNSASLIAPGIDTRGDGGYVVAAPSLHISGNNYTWEVSSRPDDTELAEVPAWLITLLTAGTGIAREKLHPDAVLAGVPQGRRDVSLFRLAALYRAQDKPQAEAERLILIAAGACSPPFETKDALLKVARAYKLYDAGTVVRIPKEAVIPSSKPRDADAPPVWREANDGGNVDRLLDRYGSDLLYCRQWKYWLTWLDGHWRMDTLEKVQEFATATARGIFVEASECENEDRRKLLAKWAVQSENAGHWAAMVTMAQHRVAALPDVFDTNPFLYSTTTGTLDLHEGILREHRREDRITKKTPVAYDPLAQAPLWSKFINEIFQEDTELISFVKRAVGYSMTGDTSEECIFVLYGSGANGKSTFMEIIREILGNYAAVAKSSLLLRSRDDPENEHALAGLKGARFIMASETNEDANLDEAKMKAMTGRDAVNGRFLFGEPFTYVPEFKIWLRSNHLPVIHSTDNGTWRRPVLIPFNAHFEGSSMDKNLRSKLRTERPGILNWMVEGCMEWQIMGLGDSATVRAATAAYRTDMDLVSAFLDACCVVDPQATVLRSKLSTAYHAWRANNGERPESTIKLNKKMKERGFTEFRDRIQGYIWNGIALLADVSA